MTLAANLEARATQRVVSVIEILPLLLMMHSSHVYGYGDHSIPILEGSGHAVLTVAFFWMSLDVANLTGVLFQEFSVQDKAKMVLIASLLIEFAPIVIDKINTTPDLKDGAMMILSVIILYYLESFLIATNSKWVKRVMKSNLMVELDQD